MADPGFGALGTIYSSGGTSVTSMTSTITNVAVGDLVLAFVQRDWQAQCTGLTIAGAAATLIKRNNSGANGFSFDVWGMVAAASSSSASVVASYSAGQPWGTIMSARWTHGVTSITPNESSCNTPGCSALASSSTSRLFQSITTTVRTLIIAAGSDWDNTRTHTPASGWTKRADGSGTPVTSIQFVLDRVADAGTFGGATAFSTTNASDQYLAVVIALPVDTAAAASSLSARSPSAKFNHLLVR